MPLALLPGGWCMASGTGLTRRTWGTHLETVAQALCPPGTAALPFQFPQVKPRRNRLTWTIASTWDNRTPPPPEPAAEPRDACLSSPPGLPKLDFSEFTRKEPVPAGLPSHTRILQYPLINLGHCFLVLERRKNCTTVHSSALYLWGSLITPEPSKFSYIS